MQIGSYNVAAKDKKEIVEIIVKDIKMFLIVGI